MELKKWNPHRPRVGHSISGHRSDEICMEQRAEGDVMKDLGKCRWQWRNRLERVNGARVSGGVLLKAQLQKNNRWTKEKIVLFCLWLGTNDLIHNKVERKGK